MRMMRFLAVSGIIILSIFGSAFGSGVENRKLQMPLDHFNLFDKRTFEQRYFVNTEFYIPGGPIFIFVSGGFETFDEFINRGVVYDLANETQGYIIALEHRYYGLSQPTADTSVPNLQYLTVHQALADIATFISHFKETGHETQMSRVILFGRGWGARLAVWARQKYPNLVDGVWASSAPINAISDFGEYLENLGDSMGQLGGQECKTVIERTFQQIDLDIWFENTTRVEERLKLCSPINVTSEEDVGSFFFTLASELGHFMKFVRAEQIREKCEIMLDPTAEDDFEGFARWFTDDYLRNLDCFDTSYDSLVKGSSNILWNSVSTISRRQNLWLQCTQIGQFVTSNSLNASYTLRFPIEFFHKLCADVFGTELFQGSFFEDSIAKTNRFFGGLNPRTYRIFFTQGDMDPFRTLGPQEAHTPYSPVMIIPNVSFARDLASISRGDSKELRETKERARFLMIKWIFDSIEEDRF